MNTKLTTTQLLELANALSIAVQMHIMSQQQAAFVWKKHLREGGFLPPKDNMIVDD